MPKYHDLNKKNDGSVGRLGGYASLGSAIPENYGLYRYFRNSVCNYPYWYRLPNKQYVTLVELPSVQILNFFLFLLSLTSNEDSHVGDRPIENILWPKLSHDSSLWW